MSIRVKTQPVEPITVSGASSAPVPEVEADVFRGVFRELVYNGQPLTREVHGTRTAGTLGFPVYYQTTGGLNTFGCASGGGVYGDDCLAVGVHVVPFTTDYLTHNRRFNSVGHGMSENTGVVCIPAPNGGTLPAGLASNNSAYDDTKPHVTVQVTADSFELSDRFSVTPSNSGGDLLFTSSGHGFVADNTVRFSGFTALDGVTPLADYYVISDGLTSSTFKISEESEGTPLPYIYHYGSAPVFRSDQGMTFTSDGTPGVCSHVVSKTGNMSIFFMGCLSDGDGTVTVLDSGNSQFFAPYLQRPFNRMEFYIKCPSGYMEYTSANWLAESFNIGTYQAPLNHDDVEKHNYHFYYQLILRHDQADGDWIRVTVGDTPSFQRDDARWDPGSNPTPLITDGDFLDNLTRFYLKYVQNIRHPELTASFDTLVDRLRIFYQDPPHPITFELDGIDTSISQVIAPIDATDYPITITNSGGTSISGNIRQAFNAGAGSDPSLNAQILDSGLSVVGLTDEVVVPASGTWTGYLRLTPTLQPRKNYQSNGVAFIPLDQITYTGGRSPGILDAANEMSNYNQEIDWGPPDAWRYGKCLHVYMSYRFTFDGDTDTITLIDGYSTYLNMQLLLRRRASGDSLPTGFAEFTTYYVVEPSGSTGKLAASSSGTPITFTDDWSSASGYFLAY